MCSGTRRQISPLVMLAEPDSINQQLENKIK